MKLVSLSPSLTEILYRLNVTKSLRAITDHCPSGDEQIQKIGSPKALNLQQIIALEPQIIFADVNENRPEELRILQKSAHVLSFDVRSLDAVMDAIAAMGRALNQSEAAAELIGEIKTEQSECKKAFENLVPVRALLLLWNNPFLTINFDTYASRLIETAGAYNVFHSDPIREFAVELEDMIEKEPEILLLPSEPYVFKKRHAAKFREYRVFSKIEIQLIDGKLISQYGPTTVKALKYFRELFLKQRTEKPACAPKP